MKKQKGFTLIELSVVMAIIAVLAVLLIGAIRAAVAARARSQHIGNARAIETALEAFAGRNGGSYCGASGVTCQNTALRTVGTQLTPAFLSQNITDGGCTGTNEGGGSINLQRNTFTISVVDQDCATVFETIIH